MTKFRPPFIQIDFQITARCNAKCVFCSCWRNSYRPEDDLPAQVWIDTAKSLRDFTAVDFLCIGGGEPLLYRDIFKVLEALREMGIHSVVVTNGSLFSYDNCKKIIDSGVGHIDFSLDGFSYTHDRLRRAPGLFKKCEEAIFLLKKIEPRISLGLSTLICGENIEELPKFTEMVLREFPIDAVNFQVYNKVVDYLGKGWWRDDPLWPKDKEVVIEVMNYLAKKAEEGAKIANHPVQFRKFRDYFINPERDLKIKCPAGRFNFSVSHKGDIIGCVAEGKIGNITEDSPIEVYENRFGAVREKADLCKENCHFLINCYFPLHWKRWNEIVKDMVEETEEVVYKPGRVVLPPEAKQIIMKHSREDYPPLIDYEQHKHLDVIGKYNDRENRMNCSIPHNIPCIYLCGDTSETHRWGVNLDEADFFKQVDTLKELVAKRAIYHTIIGIRRTNFFKLSKIYSLINKIRVGEGVGSIADFSLKPFYNIKARFYQYLEEINSISLKKGIEFRVIDDNLNSLFETIERISGEPVFVEKEFLRALGPVCKDVFTGPAYILFDLAGKCNVDCVYCRRFSPWNKDYWKGKHPEVSGFLNFDVVKNVLGDAKEMGVETILLVGGGEPTLHPRFIDIIKEIQKAGMKFNFSTNGLLLNLYNDYLVGNNCESVTVSLSFASERSFRLLRPHTGVRAMRTIENNVKALSELKHKRLAQTPAIIALYAITKYNYKEIPQMCVHAKRLGADIIWYQLVHLEDFSKDKLYMDNKEFSEVKELLVEAEEKSRELNIKFNNFINFEINHYDEKKGDWSKGGLLSQGCYVGWHFSFIHIRREIFMCCGAKTIDILTKEGRGFGDIWFSDIYRRYRNDGLIMHRENPLTIYGKPLYDSYCESCDNHDQNVRMLELLGKYKLETFVER
ncbi:MAG: hypothetical protein B1H08_02540 [Candidatus Omnitrophica bacterium 4484_171]|nr:MAG: hypothetical protein B1H08_02540 [Candidatus Omnitrophica bacterium 4484_171]